MKHAKLFQISYSPQLQIKPELVQIVVVQNEGNCFLQVSCHFKVVFYCVDFKPSSALIIKVIEISPISK
jgi:hypothetical protein